MGLTYNAAIVSGHTSALMHTPSFLPSLAAVSPWQDFLAGFALVGQALKLVMATPKLRRLSAIGAAVTAVALLMVTVAGWNLAGRIATSFVEPDTGWLQLVAGAVRLVLFFALFALGALTVPNLMLAPLQDPLSEATEATCGHVDAAHASWFRGIGLSLSHTLGRMMLMALGYLVLLPLHFIPVVGSVAWLVLSSVWSMLWLSVEHLSNPMARHRYPLVVAIKTLRRRLALALGLGCGLYLVLWVPVLNVLLMPVAVVAGTLLYLGLVGAGELHA